VYLVSNGALDWGPVKRAARPPETLASDRTSSSTVRRVPASAVAAREPVGVGAVVGGAGEAVPAGGSDDLAG
jgi:hypothetical protein